MSDGSLLLSLVESDLTRDTSSISKRLESVKDYNQSLEDCLLVTSPAKTVNPFSWCECWNGGMIFVVLWLFFGSSVGRFYYQNVLSICVFHHVNA